MLISALIFKQARNNDSKRMQLAPTTKSYMATEEIKKAATFSIVELIFLIIALIVAWNCGKANKENGLLVIINWICAFLFPMPYVVISLISSKCARDALLKPLGMAFYSYEDPLMEYRKGDYYYY